MIRLFKHYVPSAVLLLALVDALLLIVAGELGWEVRAHQIGIPVGPVASRAAQLVSFAAALQVALVAVGAYGVGSFLSLRFAAARLTVAISLGVLFLSMLYFLVPPLSLWRSNLLYAMVLACLLLGLSRAVLGRTLGSERFKRRVLVLGAGARAARLAALAGQPGAKFAIAGFVAMNERELAVDAVRRDAIDNLAAHVVATRASEVVLALEERRNALPLQDLLRVRTTGVQVSEVSTFLEGETGRIDLNSVSHSWLIFNDGFAAGRLVSSTVKRGFDIVASLVLLILTLPVVAVTAIAIKLESPGPALYRQRRVGLYNQDFDIVKLRSMRQDAEVAGVAVWAAEGDPRVTRIGRFIRKVRIDELPQAWAVLKGEMSFVGPRPERPQFVRQLEEHLPFYAERHMVKPGLTGWAQINYPYGASVEDARHKLEYDLYYAKNYSPLLDLLILLQTLKVVLWPAGGAVMAGLVLWGHALAALLFGGVALAQMRARAESLPRRAFVAAMALTALWALAIAGIDARDAGVRLAEGLRNAGWLAFMLALTRRGGRGGRGGYGLAAVYGVVMLLVCASVALGIAAATVADPADGAGLAATALLMRVMAALSALVLVRDLAAAAPARGGLRLVVIGLGALWAMELVPCAIAYAGWGWPPALVAARGLGMAAAALALGIAADRRDDWTVAISRTAALRGLAAVGLAVYAGGVALATRLVEAVGGDHARLIEAALVIGATTTLLTLVANPWLRAWARVKVAKHLFRHRYDYRAAWQRFSETLGQPGAGAAPLASRVVKAMAELTDSPAGLLLTRDGDALEVAAAWNWPDVAADGAAAATYWDADARIIELDAVRAGAAPAAEAAAVPGWILAAADAWALVPLAHGGQFAGAILLARPPVDRSLDWEDYDLLRVAARQAASCLAEDRAHAALADAARFDEFNRRFAFIMHDIKNLVSQLSLVARNAERHADNPEFRADMVATLTDSSERLQGLLARLSQHSGERPELPRPVDVAALLARVAAARRGGVVVSVDLDALALAQPGRLETVLGHLVQNAVEASPADAPVTLAAMRAGDRVAITVTDRGEGMSAAFVRDQLFRPFASTKPGGFGLGAFEARQLVEAMGGRIEVTSREGEGTCFRVLLPIAPALEKAA